MHNNIIFALGKTVGPAAVAPIATLYTLHLVSPKSSRRIVTFFIIAPYNIML